MTKQLREIGERLQALREIEELTVSGMAGKMKMDENEYAAYEKGEMDFSFSFLYNAAHILGVDVLDIMSGESPKLSVCSLVRKGEGYDINRRAAYDYKHLAFTFRQKKAEPFLVRVTPKEGEGAPTLHSHDGQEFDYMLSGTMVFYIGEETYTLNAGDSVYFDSSVAHAMKACGGDAEFLAVVMQ
jgi:transcriptional regulator with XRE-family HTH domain